MRGLPDFGNPVDAAVWASFDEPGVLVAVPAALELATEIGGHPALSLERFRGADPGRPPAGYGLVNVGLRTRYPDAVGDRPVTRRIVPVGGVLGVSLQQVDADPAAKVALPVEPIDWNGALTAHWSARVNRETITYLIGVLGDPGLPLTARADFVVRGMSARAAAVVRVDLGALWSALSVSPREATDNPRAAAGVLSPVRASIVRGALDQLSMVTTTTTPTPAIVVEPVDSVPGAVHAPNAASAADLPAVAEVLADWIVAHLDDPDARFGTREWDLRTSIPTTRPVTVSQDLHAQLGGLDPERHAPPGTVVPALDLGWLDVDVLVNLPPRRVGVLAVGVDLVAPPQLPARHQAATAGATLRDRATLVLRLAPGEEPVYTSQAWMVTSTAAGVAQVFGPVIPRTGRRLLLSPDDFGVRLVPVAADPDLLRLAEVTVTLLVDGVETSSTTLDASASETVFVVAPGAGAVLRTTLRDTAGGATAGDGATGGGQQIVLPDVPAGPIRLALAAVPGWGAHEVAVSAAPGTLAGAAGLLAVELRSVDHEWLGHVTLTSDRPTGTWRYLVTDPFRPGYLHRVRRIGDTGAGESGGWLGPEPVGAPLVIGGAP